MAVSFKDFEKIITKSKNESSLAKTITEYLTLKQKIEDLDKQSWYFKQGIDSHKKKLSSLNIDYDKVRELFNKNSIDFFNDKINENLVKIKIYNNKRMLGSIARIHKSTMTGENEFLNELIRLKSKSDLLIPIDDYFKNPEEFMKFIE